MKRRLFLALLCLLAASAAVRPVSVETAPPPLGTHTELGLQGSAKVLCSAVFVSGREPEDVQIRFAIPATRTGVTDVMVIVGEEWVEMPPEQRREYVRAAYRDFLFREFDPDTHLEILTDHDFDDETEE